MKKGIFGVKQDPSKPALFFFNVRHGDECPSDPDDSDYQPSGDDTRQERKCARIKITSKTNPLKAGVNKASIATRGTKRKSATKDDNSQSDSDSTVIMSDYEQDDNLVSSVNSNNGRPSKDITHTSLRVMSSKCKRPKLDVSGFSGHRVDLWGQHVPEIILLKIFEEVVREDGALPFLSRIATKVSNLWNRVSADPILWKNVDLSYGWIKKTASTINMLCETRFSYLEVLNLSDWKGLSEADLVMLMRACPKLSSIILKGCLITASTLMSVVDSGSSNITSIDLSATNAVSNKSMNHLFDARGSVLKSLTINDCRTTGCKDLLKLIASKCSQLESLSICNQIKKLDFFAFHIEKMQAGCPKLTSLKLVNIGFTVTHASISEQVQSQGFPCLEELVVSSSTTTESVIWEKSNNFLHRMLKRSKLLKILDLRGIQNITCNSLQSLDIPNLQCLYIGSSSVARHEGLAVLLSKWQHSLVDVDVSWNVYPEGTLDEAMNKVSEYSEKSQLRSLDVRGTQISVVGVKCLLKGCPRLETLTLDSCRCLPRGMKKQYSGKELKSLLRDINSIDHS